jgi:hypothetical protein
MTASCGGPSRLSIYHSSDPTKVSTDPAVPASPIGNYTYVNCQFDTAQPHLLSTGGAANGTSVESCLSLTESMQYKYAGLEYGTECWLGNTLTNTTANPRAPESDCNISCIGTRRELCGGANRMNLWVRNAGT